MQCERWDWSVNMSNTSIWIQEQMVYLRYAMRCITKAFKNWNLAIPISHSESTGKISLIRVYSTSWMACVVTSCLDLHAFIYDTMSSFRNDLPETRIESKRKEFIATKIFFGICMTFLSSMCLLLPEKCRRLQVQWLNTTCWRWADNNSLRSISIPGSTVTWLLRTLHIDSTGKQVEKFAISSPFPKCKPLVLAVCLSKHAPLLTCVGPEGGCGVDIWLGLRAG